MGELAKLVFLGKDKLDQHRAEVGAKTWNLFELANLGFNVPDFIFLPSSAMSLLVDSKGGIERHLLQSLQQQIANRLSAKRFAVRSSALIEDLPGNSNAGQFISRLNIPLPQVAESMHEVISHALIYLNGDLSKFSILIQEYIDADFSGVAFTRNPLGSSEMLLEFVDGSCDQLVSGAVTPRRLAIYQGQVPRKFKSKFPASVLSIFEKIENHFNFPQDIEWCSREGKFYFLQSRPISSISDLQFEQSRYLDKQLCNKDKYYFEKNAVTETAPRPTPATYSLLKMMYANDGPISRVYRKYGIKYKDTGKLKIFGNELYVDRLKEYNSIFPALCFGKGIRLNLFSPRDCLTSLINCLQFKRISSKQYQNLFESLKMKLSTATSAGVAVEDAVKIFLSEYELIFEINLLAASAINELKVALGREVNLLADVISYRIQELDISSQTLHYQQGLKGNSLELSDLDEFVTVGYTEPTGVVADQWFKSLPKWRQSYLLPKLHRAQRLERLREYGRWLGVRNINLIREGLYRFARREGFSDTTLIFFAEIDKLDKVESSEDNCKIRQANYLKFSEFQLPIVISNMNHSHRKEATIGVSAGKAEGCLICKDEIDAANDDTSGEQADRILYVKTLSPDLVKYFHRVSAIVSESGGVLSHLAILAREQKIPVVTGYVLAERGVKLGTRVVVDGSDGTVVEKQKAPQTGLKV